MKEEKLHKGHRIESCLDGLLLAGMMVFLMVYFDIRYLCMDTVVTGGDSASWQGIADHLMRVLLPAGRLTGWDMGNFCGYPNFSFYFLPPFLLAVVPAMLFQIPLAIALKWAIMSGIFMLPVAGFLGLRHMGYRFPAPIIGAAGTLILLFNESYTMFGANTLSTFAGEFCYMTAFSLFIYFCGSFFKGYRNGTRSGLNGVLLGLIGLSHLFVFIPALLLLVYAFFDRGRLRYIIGVGLRAFAVMAFWILPLVAYRHPFTTPVYMIWQEFVNLRFFAAGLLIVFTAVGPRLALGITGARQGAAGGFVLWCGAGAFAAGYLAIQALILGPALWHSGLEIPDLTASVLGAGLAGDLQAAALPLALGMGLLAAAAGGLFRRAGTAAFCGYARFVGGICFALTVAAAACGLHLCVVRALPQGAWRLALSSGWILGGVYGSLALAVGFYAGYSRRFEARLVRAAARASANGSRFGLWLALIFGCLAAYFGAHFLQVPDIRFLPPVMYALFFVAGVETIDLFLAHRRRALKWTAAVAAVYLGLTAVLFVAVRSDGWYRSNNRGYEMTPGYSDFLKVNRYLSTVYRAEGLDPLNAPRVAYEKCDLYGAYGGDRVFESLPYFSGRQTLEGIHFAGSMAARHMAFVQTEFSRDIKAPKPQILSKIDIAALPAHFELYNISQLIVMTPTVRRALAGSPHFRREADFGNISLYRYTGAGRGYVDVPRFRPALYMGENWVDDFYAWYKNPEQTDMLLVPQQYVSDERDRAVFAGQTDTITDSGTFRRQLLERGDLKIDTRLEHLKIRFTTNRIGVPHLIKVSYFPNWRVKGAAGVYPVSPHLMMVIPRSREVVLSYGYSGWELIGLAITLGWIVFALARTVWRRIGPKRTGRSTPSAGLNDIWTVLEARLDRARPVLGAVVVAAAFLAALGGGMLRNRPVRTYEAGYRDYQQGGEYSRAGDGKSAGRYYRKAIGTMRPLLARRSEYDHRDVINCLLITAMCYENLNERRTAEMWYRALIEEYPRSRYVGEAYVKLARIDGYRMGQSWQAGLDRLRQKEDAQGVSRLRDGLMRLEKSLGHYRRALEKDPWSVWAGYARDDLETRRRQMEKMRSELPAGAAADAIRAGLARMRQQMARLARQDAGRP